MGLCLLYFLVSAIFGMNVKMEGWCDVLTSCLLFTAIELIGAIGVIGALNALR